MAEEERESDVSEEEENEEIPEETQEKQEEKLDGPPDRAVLRHFFIRFCASFIAGVLFLHWSITWLRLERDDLPRQTAPVHEFLSLLLNPYSMTDNTLVPPNTTLASV
ncbi:PREDICTED: uncharacterized protein LOC109479537 [Branchiostoma belcheri]|uniref:Uncharacterized protein LOC109479537 n=1 Tax=Branchiostoma belcheri TaxID=7741 RepID=A0A6P4ZJW1_BRABE|nr:PREDICTED: uncharacterized protein LOC109479537 [Branchiostoma belcheri]KAI8502285.1 hypothetical protein Bbelb_198730 [Branchiostoma belcheri]